MVKRKKIACSYFKTFLIFLGIILLQFSTVKAKTITSVEDIDWSKPVPVVISGYKNINTVTVKYEDISFDVTFFGVDVVKSYEKSGQVLNDFEKNYYTSLLRSNNLLLEVDSKTNMYNKDGVIQSWIWASGELFQGQLVAKGNAKISKDLCSYSDCTKYYNVLKTNQDLAKTQLLGLWGANQVKYKETVGGAEHIMIKFIENINMPTLYGIVAFVLSIIIIAIVCVILKKKHGKKTTKNNNEIRFSKVENTKKENNSDTISENEVKETICQVDRNVDSEFNDYDMKNKNLLLNIVSNNFHPKDIRSKDLLESIKLELIIIDEDLKFEKHKWFIKPMKNSKLTKYCKERTDITQININNGLIFEDVILNIMPLLENCENIYSWGKSVLLQLQKEGKEKLSADTFNKLNNILEKKYINYKEDFAERNEITPCSLVKAADLSDQIKEVDAVDTMLNIYKIERI